MRSVIWKLVCGNLKGSTVREIVSWAIVLVPKVSFLAGRNSVSFAGRLSLVDGHFDQFTDGDAMALTEE